MLSSCVILAQHPRQFFSAKPSRSRCLCVSLFSRPSSKSLPFNSFADRHPLNPVASIFYKNIGGRGYSWRSSSPKSFPCHTSENSPVTPTIATDPKTHFLSPAFATHPRPPRESPPSRIHTAQPHLGAFSPAPSRPACTSVLSSALLTALQPRKRARNDRTHPRRQQDPRPDLRRA